MFHWIVEACEMVRECFKALDDFVEGNYWED